MNDLEKAKVIKFISDKQTSDSVFDAILTSFLKKKSNQDIYLLAASRLAVDLLTEAWKELESLKEVKSEVSPGVKQVGV